MKVLFRRALGVIAASAVVVGAMVVAAGVASAADPGTCTKSIGPQSQGYPILGTCSSVPAATSWLVTGLCVVSFSSPPVVYQVYGNQLSGNGTSTARCRLGDGPSQRSSDIAFIIVSDGSPHTPIIGKATGKCVAVSGGSSSNTTKVIRWPCNNTRSQDWTFNSDGTLRALGKCLNVKNGNTGNATPVELYDCTAGWGSEQWRARPDGSIWNPYSGRCLDDPTDTTADGRTLQIYDCVGTANQRWTIQT